ncbi:TIGR03885 family FMN-dependent LLM class oxidoreductase [uncultured Pseudokineococcus sp.]|uniref:TIGR03885 family FMN-dependent LLM class oxidoreductase n=1 Tax=uncultured Pseudokineococcus sp. TaxID=1642928 RepID=UPI00260B49E4|nr:TIGR03885 family FMN-dependent LLM class oxidoreductase [uncultured Pseudokineococcus sp.]
MTVVGFHASHEQIPPSRLLRDVVRAEEVGFSAAMCSDHITPWSSDQGQSGFAWSWLGAALTSTSLTFGVVHAPGQRYHPAISAQMVATLAEMFPQRFWAALGTGQLMNEHVTGTPWPTKDERDARLAETVDVVRRLLAGEEVTHRGRVDVDRARVWSRPPVEAAPALLAAAISARTAAWAGSWADGLITVNSSPEVLREVSGAYRDAGGRGPLCLQVHVAWAPSRDEALALAHHQWRTNVFGSQVLSELATPAQFDDVGRQVTPAGVDGPVVVEHDMGRLAERLHEMVDVGFDRVYLHFVGQDQDAWLDAAGRDLLPQLGVTAPEPLVGTTGPGTTAGALAERTPRPLAAALEGAGA